MPDSRKLLHALRSDPARLQQKLLAGKIGLWSMSIEPTEQRIVISEDLLEQYGYAAADFPSDWETFQRTIIHQEDVEGINQAVQNSCLHGAALAHQYRVWSKKDNSWRWVFVFGSPDYVDPEGSFFRLSGGVQDVTDGVEASLAMQVRSQNLAECLQTSSALLDDVQRHVEDIASGRLSADHESEMARQFGQAVKEGVNVSAKRLGVAFDALADKMVWHKAILDSLPFPVAVADTGNRWTYMNAPALEAHGFIGLDEAKGALRVPLDAGASGFLETEGETKSFTFYHEKLDRFYQGVTAPFFGLSGKRIGLIEVMQDVTESHAAEERTRILLDSMPLGCNFWDESFYNIDCNEAAAKLFDLKNKQEYLDRFFELSPEFQPDGQPTAEKALAKITKAFTEGSCTFEWMHQKLDGTPMPCEIHLVRVPYRGRSTVAGYTRDLREIKAKQAELDQERDLLRKVMDSCPVCFVILVGGFVSFATPHTREFLGIEIGDAIADYYTDDSQRLGFFTELRQAGTVNWRVVSMRSRDGSVKEMLANAFLADYAGEACAMSWFLDVTEMREKEKELSLARDAAEESTRAKSDFLANMSHEIRTPMNAILGLTRIVLDTRLDTHQRDYLLKTEFSARALLRILNDILDFSKIEAGKLEMENVLFNPAGVMQNVWDMYAVTARSKGLELVLDLDPSVPAELKGDPLRLSQVLTNLAGNAIKFTENGNVTLHMALVAAGVANGGGEAQNRCALRFSVADTGIGIDPVQRCRLFTPFSQADTSTTRRYGGTGLGLAISKTLVEMMGGEIACEPVEPHGTNFYFTAFFNVPDEQELPRASEEHLAFSVSAGVGPESVSHLAGAHILVAEDNDINQIIAREMLERAGFVVDMADNGRQAVEMALANPYDLVFMDIQMPVLDGLEATKQLRQHHGMSSLPIVAMTAHAMVGDKEKSLANGMNDHITKPLDASAVFSAIAKHVAGRAGYRVEGLGQLRDNASVMTSAEQSGTPAHSTIAKSKEVTMDPSDLPVSIDGVDLVAGLPRVANNKKLYKRLLLQVADDSAAQREKMTAAVMAGDMTAVKELAHSLKGASGNLAMTRVYEASMALEAAAKSEDFAQVFTNLDALEQALDAFVVAVQPLRG